MTARLFRMLLVEARRRVDTVGAVVGWASLAVIIAGVAVVAGVLVGRSGDVADLSALVVVAGLPATLGIAFAGAVIGVGDSPWHGDRLVVAAGGTCLTAFLARLGVCVTAVVATFVWVIVSGSLVAVVCGLNGSAVHLIGAAHAMAGLAVLLTTAAWLGFGFGAATGSRAIALVGMPLVLVLGDTLLGFAPPWLSAFRFSAVQAFALESGPPVPAVLAATVWLVLPTTIGVLRSVRGAA